VKHILIRYFDNFVQDLILSLTLKGFGIHYETGFSTDFSESCIWMTPLIKEPGDPLQLM
jgi:hypothetical protein